MTATKGTINCSRCEKLKSIITWLVQEVREADATVGEAFYDMCQKAQRRMKDEVEIGEGGGLHASRRAGSPRSKRDKSC